MSIQIRQILKTDNQELADLIREVFREFGIDRPGTVYTDPTTDHLFELFREPGSIYWVAEEGGRIVGGCGVFPTPGLPSGYAELVKFYIRKEARGKGLGKLLMDRVIESAKQFGYSFLYLESFPELKKAVTLYEKAGFKPISNALGNSGHYACNLWMALEL